MCVCHNLWFLLHNFWFISDKNSLSCADKVFWRKIALPPPELLWHRSRFALLQSDWLQPTCFLQSSKFEISSWACWIIESCVRDIGNFLLLINYKRVLSDIWSSECMNSKYSKNYHKFDYEQVFSRKDTQSCFRRKENRNRYWHCYRVLCFAHRRIKKRLCWWTESHVSDWFQQLSSFVTFLFWKMTNTIST